MSDPGNLQLPLGEWLAPLEATVMQLWSELLLASPEKKRLLFTGTADGDGVTTVAAVAALGIARNLRRRTLLIETNVRRPGLAAFLGTDGPGFAEFCRGEAPIQQAIRTTDTPLLHAIVAGQASTSAGLFAEKGVSDLLDGLGGVYDRIVIDAAPVADHPDTLLLVRKCDAVAIVACAHRSRGAAIRATAARLRATGVPLVGTVLNQVRSRVPRWLESAPAPAAQHRG